MEQAQLTLDLTTDSPINVERLSGQNRRLLEWLMSGKRINCFHPAMRLLKIGYLNSRRSDLVNKYGIPVKDRYIEVDRGGEMVTVKEYYL